MANIGPCEMELTEVKSRECTHFWKIENYSTVPQKQGGKLTSVKFSAVDDDLIWYLEHTLHMKSIHETFVSFSLRSDCYDVLRKCESVSGFVTVYIMHVAGQSHDEREYPFKLSYNEQNSNCKVAEYDMGTIQDYVEWSDALTIICKVSYRKKNETVPISCSNNSNDVRISESRLSSDMEKCFSENNFKDVTISVKGKQYRGHKNILAARSTVFEKMLTVEMLESESKKNHIDITDVDHEPFEEMLYYIYTGKVKNLDESAFELLPLADKYDLEELRSVCEKVLVKKLTIDNAAKILILADTHRIGELKAHALRFLKENYESCTDFKDPEFWKNLATSNAQLLNEIVAFAFCKR